VSASDAAPVSLPSAYRDFAITIEPAEAGGLRVRLLESPRLAFGRWQSHPFAQPFTAEQVGALLRALEQPQKPEDHLEAPVDAPSTGRSTEPSCANAAWPTTTADADSSPDAGPERNLAPPPALIQVPQGRAGLEAIGERLFTALFGGTIAEQLEKSLVWCESDPARGLRVRIVIDPECPHTSYLAGLPWELLRCRQRRSFLGRNPATPIIRHLEVERGPGPAPARRPLRVLVAMANPSPAPSLDLARERCRIEQDLRLRPGIEATFCEHATIHAIRRELADHEYHALHFMGHGQLDPTTGHGSLVLDDGSGRQALLAAEDLADCLRGTSRLRLVVLNACGTGAMPHRKGIDPLMSVAAALSLAGCPAVLAMQASIADEAAIAFSSAFYGALARGLALEAALTEARLALVGSWPTSAAWATPVLYMRGRTMTLVAPDQGPPPDPPAELERHIIKSASLIAERTRGFVGRDFVFNRIDECISSHTSGYFLLLGEPGIGKTSIIAKLVRRRCLPHHFIVHSLPKTTRISGFMRNICSQLIIDNHLSYRTLRSDVSRSSDFLVVLLEELSKALPADGRLVLLLDALDEADDSELRRSGNLFDLPPHLPEKVFIVLTAQGDRSREIPLRLDTLREKLEIPSDSPENLRDIATYIRSFLDREHVRAYIVSQNADDESFVEELSHRCQGNFMYLRYVLEDIAQGRYLDRRPDELPFGLTNYYEDLWTRMKARGERSWFDEKLPVIAALTVAQRPVSVGFIDRALVGLGRQKIAAVLAEWQHLLRRERVETLAGQVSRFCLHHASFHQFIAAKDEVAAERVDLAEISLAIARASAAGIE